MSVETHRERQLAEHAQDVERVVWELVEWLSDLHNNKQSMVQVGAVLDKIEHLANRT